MSQKQNHISIIKASGQRTVFKEQKLRDSIRRAGIPPEVEQEAIADVESRLYNQITTREIYQNLSNFLQKSTYPQGKAKYSLKQAIMTLGPSGHPFEIFIGEVFKSRGYQIILDTTVNGKCVQHEIDVVASKDDQVCLIECKFHNQPGSRTDVKTALYVKARFDDLIAGGSEMVDSHKISQPWLVTNTKLTTQAIKYCQCAGVAALGWNYPPQDPLRDWISQANLYPLTCLATLSQSQKERLLEQKIVLCRDLLMIDHQIFHDLGLSNQEIDQVINEARLVG